MDPDRWKKWLAWGKGPPAASGTAAVRRHRAGLFYIVSYGPVHRAQYEMNGEFYHGASIHSLHTWLRERLR